MLGILKTNRLLRHVETYCIQIKSSVRLCSDKLVYKFTLVHRFFPLSMLYESKGSKSPFNLFY